MIRMKNPNASQLPSEYQEVEYIEFRGSQHVDIGLPVAPNFYIDMDLMITESPLGGDFYTIMGTADSNSKGYRFWVFTISDSLTVNCGLINNAVSTKTLALNKKHNIRIKFFNGEQNLYVDDELYCSATNVANSEQLSEFSSLSNLRIGARVYSPNYLGYFKGKIYRFKMCDENNTTIRNYVPCYQKSNNEAGLYDLVNNKFEPNADVGSFLFGDEVNKKDVNIEPKIDNYSLIKNLVGDKLIFNSNISTPAYTKLLMHFENDLSDSTGLNIPTVYGTATYGSGKIGNAFVFNGSSAIKIPYNSNIVFGTNDFTIAGWFYLPTQTIGYSCLFSHKYRVDSTYRYSGFSVGFDKTSRKLFFQVYTTYSAQFSQWGSVDIPVNQWLHIAFVRSGNNFTLYVDGKKYLSATNSSSLYQHTSASFKIGSATNESASNDNPQAMLTSGSMVDEFIIVNGSALWTGEFTPPERQYD